MLRVWQLGEGVRGSTMAATRGQLVIAGYRPSGPGRARWYDESSLLRTGVTTLVEDDAGAGQVAMTRSTRVPSRLQGLAFTRAGLAWAVSSRVSCGVVRPGGPPLDFVPGAEDLVVDRRSIWTVSEASAPPYRDPGGGARAAAAAPGPGGRRGRRPGDLRAVTRTVRTRRACPAEMARVASLP